MWARLRGETGKIVADWAIRPSLRNLESNENGGAYDADEAESSSEIGHCEDPTVYSADDDNSNQSCGHTCAVGPGCKNCFTSSGGSELEEADAVPIVRLGPLTSPEPEPGGTVPEVVTAHGPADTLPSVYTFMPMLTLLQERRDRVAVKVDKRIEELLHQENREPDRGKED